MRKLAVLVTLGLALAVTSTAGAVNEQKLSFFKGGAGSVNWTTEAGSSTSGDNHALRLSVTTLGTDYAGAYALGTGLEGDAIADVTNLRFDVKGYVGAGSPRISLPVDTNGDGSLDLWAYLSAYYCAGSGAAATGWFTADFTSPTCAIYTSAGGPYAGLGGLAAAYPGAEVADQLPFFILDEPGVAYLDDLGLGDLSWTRPGKPGIVTG